MTKLPWDKFFYDDLDDDCSHLSLAARGAWIWIIMHLRLHDGESTLSLEGWSRVIRANIEETETAILELIQERICDSSVTCHANVTLSHKNVTLSCRRIKRESKIRNQNKIRKQKQRGKDIGHATVTPIESESDTDKEKIYKKESVGHAQESTVFPCRNGSQFELPLSLTEELKKAYPLIDFDSEIREARAWTVTNPGKRKTIAGMPRFLNAWMKKATNDRKTEEGRRRDDRRTPLPRFDASRL